jgi:uncharacterized membrane protein
MNSKTYLIPFIAILAVMIVGFASANQLTTSDNIKTFFNDVQLTSGSTQIAGITGDTVPVRVVFTANTDASDVRVKVWMEGYRSDISATTSRMNLVSGSTYSELLNLQLPSDLTDLTTDFTLHVSVSNADNYDEDSYSVEMQRDSYKLDVLSVDYPTSVGAGETVPVAIVVRNNGMETLQDGYVIASIPSLGISSKAYFGDLVPVENCSDDCNQDNSVQKIVYVKVPESTAAGVYELKVQVYNSDATTTVSKMISVGESASITVLAATMSQDIRAGETKTYNLIVVNSENQIKILNLQTVSGNSLLVSAPTVATVGPQSSVTIPITVTANEDANVGTYTFSATVDGKQTVFTANVVSGSVIGSNTSVIALTVVLVIIFIVLLIVLIVLLTRRDKTSEEVETSYY